MDSTPQTDRIPSLSQQPPLEIVEQGRVWLVKVYRRGGADGEIFSTHDTQMDAVRATKTKMEEDNHPCALRWDAPESVGNLYWNPLFEYLEVRHDELLDVWSIVPAEGTFAMDSRPFRGQACKRAKQIQHDYNFKHLRAYDESTDEFEEHDHRFIRHDITSSGVRFDPSALDGPAEEDDEDGEDDETVDGDGDSQYVGPASPSQLGVSIPDVTKVEFVNTDGVLNRYATPWGDGTNAEILAVSRKYADNEQIRSAFGRWLSRWEAVDDESTVATIYQSDTAPVPWVAYQAGDHTLDAVGTDLPVDRRIDVLEQLATAIDTVATTSGGPVCGIQPRWIHVHTGGRAERTTLSHLGIRWDVQESLGGYAPTAFTAPEQLDGRLTETTAVYQLGAVACYLLCETAPVREQHDIAATIEAGDIPQARPVEDVPDSAGSVIDRALNTAPADRYTSVKAFYQALHSTLDF